MGGDVDETLQKEQRLGLSGAADGIDRHGVAEDAVEVHADRGNPVEAGDDLGEPRGRDGRGEHRDIGAVVGLGLHAQADETATGVEREIRRGDEVAGLAVGQREFGALAGPAQAAAELARRPRDQRRFGVDRIFRPEAAADVLGDEP